MHRIISIAQTFLACRILTERFISCKGWNQIITNSGYSVRLNCDYLIGRLGEIKATACQNKNIFSVIGIRAMWNTITHVVHVHTSEPITD